MKNLTNRQLIKEFNKFLRENECASKFYVNRAKQKKKSMSKMLTRTIPEAWLLSGFGWGRTPQGDKYWENVNFKWVHRLKEIGCKP